jgi:L-malate glycosyltransferase
MHNLSKIRMFRVVLWITYPIAFLFVFPFAAFARKKTSSLFFFFDRYCVGGAQKVHLDIIESIRDKQKSIYFTRNSGEGGLRSVFFSLPNSFVRDVAFWCEMLLFRPFAVHYFAFFVNRHHNPVVFGANSTFYYDLLPFLKPSSYPIELLHNFMPGKNGMQFFGLANVHLIKKRMVIDDNTYRDIDAQYREFGVSADYMKRVEMVEFGVDVPPYPQKEHGILHVLYAGRSGEQKRVWLIDRIARHFINLNMPVKFHFAGPVQHDLSTQVIAASSVYGEVANREIMNELLTTSHVVLMTSAFEGFPVFIKEGMANGAVPVVTALPGNRKHLTHTSNALLINEIENEEKVVEEGIRMISYLISQPDQWKIMSINAYAYAQQHFGKDSFLKRYREILT